MVEHQQSQEYIEEINKNNYIDINFKFNNDYLQFFTDEQHKEKSKIFIYYIISYLNDFFDNDNTEEAKNINLSLEQLQSIVDFILSVNDDDFNTRVSIDFLKSLNMKELNYVVENLRFDELNELSPNSFGVDLQNEIFNDNFIIDMYDAKYEEYYYYNNDQQNTNNILEPKTKLDYIEKSYINDPYYKNNVEHIKDYMRLSFTKMNTYNDICHNNELTINSNQIFKFIYILTNVDINWSEKFKWFLLYLNKDQLDFIGI